MNHKRKICFVTPTLQMGGMERVVSLLSNHAAKNGYDVYIICLMNKKSYYYLDDRVNVLEPAFEYKKGLLNKTKVFYHVSSCLFNVRPSVVLSFSEVFNPLSIISAKLANVPVYISDRSNPKKKLSFLTQRLRKFTYPLAKGIISQTELAKIISLNKGYNNNITVIPNPLREINDNIKRIKEPIIISVGRLVPTKNYKELIDIFFEIENEKNWQLWILGDGPDRDDLQEHINKLKLNDRVTLFGAVKDVDSYLSKASIFAFPSISEGFPNALSEAIAYPLPCIAYDCPAGPADLIKNEENGFLIPINDRGSFKIHLEKLMIDSALRRDLVINYQLHRDKYHIKSISEMYLSFITN